MFALQASGVAKSYGGVTALKGVDFAVRPGTVHALLGENGAGKSTLVKIMTGAVQPDLGNLQLGGRPVSFRSSAEAVQAGVAIVAQELSLFPHLDILDNLFPMREPRSGPFVSRRKMREKAMPVLAELGIDRRPETLVADLSLAERQLVEIAKALTSNPKVLLLDEPTSALETGASARLLRLIGILRERKVGVVFVSHILEQVMALCDEVTVLRDGAVTMAQQSLASLTIPDLVHSMLGERERHVSRPRSSARSDLASGLRVEGVSSDTGLRDVSFTIAAGEIVGLAGLAGSGPEAILSAICGLTDISAGSITLPDGGGRPTNLRQAINRGVAYVSGDRRKLGLMLDKPTWENIIQVRSVDMADDGAMLSSRRLRRRASELAHQLGVKTRTVDATAGTLSGGNQQKVVLAKWLDRKPKVLLLDDPTRGVDIGARAEINAILRETAANGAVVIYLSTDLEELVSGCDRIIVFYRGMICAEFHGESLSAKALSHTMNAGTVTDHTPSPKLERAER